MKKQEEAGAYVIVSVVQNHRPEVKALLLRNGVSLPSDTSNLDASRVIVELLKKSKNFKNEFVKLLSNEKVLNNLSSDSQYANFTDFTQYQVADTYSSNVGIKPVYVGSLTSSSPLTTASALSSTNTKTEDTETKPKTGFTLDKGLALASQGLNAFLQLSQNKTDQALAEASIIQAQSAGSYPTESASAPATGLSTGWMVLLGILGIGIVGGGIWYFNKNKK
jgi:LPXTG-motif cell wall-anchored protein